MFFVSFVQLVAGLIFRRHQGEYREWRADQGQQQRKEDEEATDNLLIAADPTIGETIPEDAVFGLARESRAGQQFGSDTNSGRIDPSQHHEDATILPMD